MDRRLSVIKEDEECVWPACGSSYRWRNPGSSNIGRGEANSASQSYISHDRKRIAQGFNNNTQLDQIVPFTRGWPCDAKTSSSSSSSEHPSTLWDCGSSLYDSFELFTFMTHLERCLTAAAAASSSSSPAMLSSTITTTTTSIINHQYTPYAEAKQDRKRRSFCSEAMHSLKFNSIRKLASVSSFVDKIKKASKLKIKQLPTIP